MPLSHVASGGSEHKSHLIPTNLGLNTNNLNNDKDHRDSTKENDHITEGYRVDKIDDKSA